MRALLSILATHSISPGKQIPASFEKKIARTVRIDYLLFLPKGYPDAEEKWPLILFLHGAGERGNEIEKVKTHGIPKMVETRPDFPFVVVSPQCPSGEWWDPHALTALLDEIVETLPIDEERIYVTGMSMGGHGTWELALRYPDRFAAIAPVCGIGNAFLAPRIAHLPVWAFHGEKDTIVPFEGSSKMVAALENLGAEVRFTRYPEAGHDSWTETYNNPELYEWFLEHRRKPR